MCRTIENSIRKSAKSRDNEVTCLGFPSDSGNDEAAYSSGGCSEWLFGLDSAPISCLVSVPEEGTGIG